MQVNKDNIDAYIAGMTKALNNVKQKEVGIQKILEQTTASQVNIEEFVRSLTPYVVALLQATVAEVEGLKAQINQLMQMKQQFESNIVIPDVIHQDQNTGLRLVKP